LLAGFPLVVRLAPEDRAQLSSLFDRMLSEWHAIQ